MEPKTKFRPISNRVLIRRDEDDDKTKGGIYIPDTAKKRPARGEVLAVGPGLVHPETGLRADPEVKRGDVVIFDHYAGDEIVIDGEKYFIVRADSIQGVVES